MSYLNASFVFVPVVYYRHSSSKREEGMTYIGIFVVRFGDDIYVTKRYVKLLPVWFAISPRFSSSFGLLWM